MDNTATQPEVMTAREAARFLRCGADKVRRLTSRGIIPGRRIGGAYRYYRSHLQAWLDGEASPQPVKRSQFLPPVRRTMSERVP